MFSGSIVLLHHLGKKLDRENLKRIVEVENDIPKAKAKLEQLIAEHDSYLANAQNDKTAKTDNYSLHHAMEHLSAFEASGEESQKDRTARALSD